MLAGALLFGVGWALSGTCPGTALAQIGEGRLVGLYTASGILLGTALYRWVGDRLESWLGLLDRPLWSRRRPLPGEAAE